jgi:hypothetical protein
MDFVIPVILYNRSEDIIRVFLCTVTYSAISFTYLLKHIVVIMYYSSMATFRIFYYFFEGMLLIFCFSLC